MDRDETEAVIKETIEYANWEIQKTKRKYRLIVAAIALAVTGLLLFLAFRPVSVDLGESDIFTEEERQSAVECVKKDFASYHGCKLYALTYSGDVQSLRETGYRLGSGYDEFIVIRAVFLSPIFGGGAWSAARIYDWSWTLGRNAGGEWVVIDRGCC